jgi:chromosome segregation ATPase
MSTNAEQLKQVKNQLAQLERQQELLMEELQAERDQGVLNEEILDRKIEQVKQKKEQLNRKLEKAKAHIRKRKREIKHWKESVERIEQLDKTAELDQLQKEIAWRASDIATKQEEIAALYTEKNEVSGVLVNLQAKMMIVEQGYHEKDISEDPRLLAITGERNTLQATLAGLGE